MVKSGVNHSYLPYDEIKAQRKDQSSVHEDLG